MINFGYAKKEILRERQEWETRVAEAKVKSCEDDVLKDEALSFCRKATKEDWLVWLEVYAKSKGDSKPFTHFYDYPFDQCDFYVAIADLTLPPLYGALSISLIVPENVTVYAEDLGHNTLYLHGNPPTTSPHATIPYYSDLG